MNESGIRPQTALRVVMLITVPSCRCLRMSTFNKSEPPTTIESKGKKMSKSFIELFTDARAVSTPLIAIRTFDAISTIQAVSKSLGDDINVTPLGSWDSIHGLRGLNEGVGDTAVSKMAAEADMQLGASVDLPICLGIIEKAEEDVIIFIHNPQLVWGCDTKVIQGIANLRNDYKAAGNMVILLIGVGDVLPVELQQDILVLEQPLPTREELAKIVTATFAYAANGDKKFLKCKNGATPEVIKATGDALIGLPEFPAEQSVAQTLDKLTGTIDIETLWNRKKDIVSQKAGLSYHAGKETLKDMYGVESVKNFGIKFMNGKYSPTVLLRVDEIEKQFAGNASDSSGVKGDMLGEWLTWVNDRGIICSLFLGVPGSSKSWSAYCLGGEFGKPVINYSISAMQDQHVGNSGKNLRTANRTIDSISDGRIWLIATANSLNGLPPELVSRFQVGGIFFFDAPDAQEREGIMKLKITKYNLADQPLPDMTNWTGRDIENCARKADLLDVSLVEAGEYVVPLLTSHREQMDALRQSASGRFLSASKQGVYQYTSLPEKHSPVVKMTEGRKMR